MNHTTSAIDEAQALRSLTALAQVQRLRAFKALVVAGPEGLTPGVLAQQLESSPSALSFHLKELAHSGLIACEQRGRNLIYTANFAQMTGLLDYLSAHCCNGADCQINSIPALPTKETMTPAQPLNVLFLCTHNSARSILAEAILNHIGQGRFKGYSAGSSPRANQQPNPIGLQTLKNAGISTDGLHSKSWDEFALPDAPHMDLIITVCDNAAGEVCPYWPGQPATAHWGYADPSAGDGTDVEKAEAFRQTLHLIRRRLDLLVNLPAEKLETMAIQTTAKELAQS